MWNSIITLSMIGVLYVQGWAGCSSTLCFTFQSGTFAYSWGNLRQLQLILLVAWSMLMLTHQVQIFMLQFHTKEENISERTFITKSSHIIKHICYTFIIQLFFIKYNLFINQTTKTTGNIYILSCTAASSHDGTNSMLDSEHTGGISLMSLPFIIWCKLNLRDS